MNKLNKEVALQAHKKWLAKAETAEINGSEMTVLPYGFLSQAIEEELNKRDKEWEGRIASILNELENQDSEAIGWEILEESGSCCPGDDCGEGYMRAIKEVREKLNIKEAR